MRQGNPEVDVSHEKGIGNDIEKLTKAPSNRKTSGPNQRLKTWQLSLDTAERAIADYEQR